MLYSSEEAGKRRDSGTQGQAKDEHARGDGSQIQTRTRAAHKEHMV